MTKKQAFGIIERLTPQCGLTNFMIAIGCFADIYFTFHFKWQAWEFGMVFTGILVPGKAAKTFSDFIGKKK